MHCTKVRYVACLSDKRSSPNLYIRFFWFYCRWVEILILQKLAEHSFWKNLFWFSRFVFGFRCFEKFCRQIFPELTFSSSFWSSWFLIANPVEGKILFLSYDYQIAGLIRLQDFSNSTISRNNWVMLFACEQTFLETSVLFRYAKYVQFWC